MYTVHHTHTCMHTRTCAHTHTQIHTQHTPINVHTYTCICTHAQSCTCTCTHTHARTHTHTRTFTHTCSHTQWVIHNNYVAPRHRAKTRFALQTCFLFCDTRWLYNIMCTFVLSSTDWQTLDNECRSFKIPEISYLLAHGAGQNASNPVWLLKTKMLTYKSSCTYICKDILTAQLSDACFCAHVFVNNVIVTVLFNHLKVS